MYDPPYVWRHTWKQQLLEATQLGSWCYRCLLHNHGLQGSSGELHQGGSGELPGQFTIRAGQNFATYELYFAYGPVWYLCDWGFLVLQLPTS